MQTNRYLILFLGIALLAGCTSVNSTEKESEQHWWDSIVSETAGHPDSTQPLEFTLELSEHTISRDDSLEMTLRMHNVSTDSIEVGLGVFAYDLKNTLKYDFVVLSLDSTKIWNRLPDLLSLLGTSVKLAPGEKRSFSHIWNLTYENGIGIGEGTFLVFGGFPSVEYIDPETSERFLGPVATEMQEIVIE